MGFLVNHFKKKQEKLYDDRRQNPPYRCLTYEVCGINPKSNRKKTVRVVCGSWENEQDILNRSGLVAPYDECHPCDELVTDSQLELMAKEKIPMPNGITKREATNIITHHFDEEPLFPDIISLDVLKYAVSLGVLIPRYTKYEDVIELLKYKEKALDIPSSLGKFK